MTEILWYKFCLLVLVGLGVYAINYIITEHEICKGKGGVYIQSYCLNLEVIK